MSFNAVEWAFQQPVKPSSAKFVLVAMAQAVNAIKSQEMVCFPSAAAIAEATGQDRKTVLDSIRRLRELGYIAPTGTLRGRTGQVTEYVLKSPESGTVSHGSNSTESGLVKAPEIKAAELSNGTEIGTVKQYQKRTSTENGTGPEFPVEQSRFSLETVPFFPANSTENGTRNKEGIRKEQGKEKGSRAPSPDLDMFGGVLRDVDPQVLADFTALRQKQRSPITATALAGLAREGGKAGITLTDVMRFCCESGWRGFKADWYAKAAQRGQPTSAAQGSARTNGHLGTDQRNYEEDFDGKPIT